MKLISLCLIALGLVVGFFFFVWPTPWYIFVTPDGDPCRVNRITGELQCTGLYQDGSKWVKQTLRSP